MTDTITYRGFLITPVITHGVVEFRVTDSDGQRRDTTPTQEDAMLTVDALINADEEDAR